MDRWILTMNFKFIIINQLILFEYVNFMMNFKSLTLILCYFLNDVDGFKIHNIWNHLKSILQILFSNQIFPSKPNLNKNEIYKRKMCYKYYPKSKIGAKTYVVNGELIQVDGPLTQESRLMVVDRVLCLRLFKS